MAKVELAQLLLGPKYYKENFGKPIVKKTQSTNDKGDTVTKEQKDFDLAKYYFGGKFQNRLRRKLHKTDSQYKCAYCRNTGIKITNGKKYYEFVQFIAESGEIEMTKDIKQAFKSLGFSVNIRQKRNKKKRYAVATPLYKILLSDAPKAMADINAKVKKMRKDNQGDAPSKESYEDVLNFINRLGEFKNMLTPCPVCLGNGYYDIGHTSFVGKQVDCMRLIYERFIVTEKRPWTYKVDEGVLWQYFDEQDVAPEIPEQLPRNLQLNESTSEIGMMTINRLHEESQRIGQIKQKFYESMNNAYKTGTASFVSKATYEQILAFYKALITSSRTLTYTLREFLMADYHKLKADKLKQARVYQTEDGKTPYLGDKLIINGPTVTAAFHSPQSKKLGNRTDKYSLYVYAERFVRKDTGIWNDKTNTTVDSLESQFEMPDKFIIYFPQRNAN